MLKPQRVLVDTNVWIAYFMGDETRCPEVASFFESCLERGVDLLYAPTSLKDVFYLLPRLLRRAEGEDMAESRGESYVSAAWACARKMADLATAAPLSMAECELSWMLRGQHPDLEDNLLIAAAETSKADYLVTFDKTLSGHFAPVCATPAELTRLLCIGGGQ